MDFKKRRFTLLLLIVLMLLFWKGWYFRPFGSFWRYLEICCWYNGKRDGGGGGAIVCLLYAYANLFGFWNCGFGLDFFFLLFCPLIRLLRSAIALSITAENIVGPLYELKITTNKNTTWYLCYTMHEKCIFCDKLVILKILFLYA